MAINIASTDTPSTIRNFLEFFLQAQIYVECIGDASWANVFIPSKEKAFFFDGVLWFIEHDNLYKQLDYVYGLDRGGKYCNLWTCSSTKQHL